MRIFLAGGNGKKKIIPLVHSYSVQTGGNIPTKEKRYILTIAGGGGFSVDGSLSGKPPHPNEVQLEQCDCSWQGSPRGGAGGYDPIIRQHKPYILESFYYADADTERLLPYFGDFMLDSGAFTFCGTGGFHESQFEEYLEKYADFIKRNKVKKFFELDVDSITGYEKVKQYRKRLESLTGAQSIPVWHVERGKDEYIRHCDEYPYVALGGYVAAIKAGDPRQKAYVRSYPWFINEAHKRGSKIHGLGYTSLEGLKIHHFDSVDSTAWTTGNRFGYVYWFDGKTMRKKDPPKGHRLADSRTAALHNYTEWIKFQKYAETHL